MSGSGGGRRGSQFLQRAFMHLGHRAGFAGVAQVAVLGRPGQLAVVARAAELAFTGDMIDAEQALDWNLVSRVVPHDELMTATHAMASKIAQHAPHGLRLTKRLMIPQTQIALQPNDMNLLFVQVFKENKKCNKKFL